MALLCFPILILSLRDAPLRPTAVRVGASSLRRVGAPRSALAGAVALEPDERSQQEDQKHSCHPNSLQAEAIRSSSGAVLLLASPGTGKTRVLCAHMAYLLLNKGVEQGQILGLTFTQHAAEQLRVRVSSLASSALENVWIGTFHSICARMLREHSSKVSIPAIPPNFHIAGQGAQLALVQKIMRQMAMAPTRTQGGSPSAAQLLRRIQLWKELGLHPADVQQEIADDEGCFAQSVYPEYQRLLLQNNQLDYNDLTLCVLKLFAWRPDVLAHYRQRFRHVVVDELQDSSTVARVGFELLPL